MRSALLLVGAGVVAALASAPDRPRTATPESPPEVAVAPMPRAVEDTRVELKDYKGSALPADAAGFEEMNGVRFKVTAKVRRLTSTGRDTIDFDWRVEYNGPRHPLIMMRPSLTDGWPKMTDIAVYAFPRGSEIGRYANFATPEPAGGVRALALAGAPARAWFLTVPKGGAETGTVSLLVADLKAELRGKYPSEFPDAVPPKLYARFYHQPDDRGDRHDLDAWTGTLLGDLLELPDLESW